MKHSISALLLTISLFGSPARAAALKDQEKVGVLACLLCDSARDTGGGKLMVGGTFDTLVAPSVPTVHPSFDLALRLQVLASAYGDHKLRVEVTGPDGKAVLEPKLERAFKVGVGPGAGLPFVTKNLVINFKEVRFDAFGTYTMSVVIDDHPPVLQSFTLKQGDK